MTKSSKRTRKNVAEVLAEAQAITVTGPIDHASQFGSWQKDEAPAEELSQDEVLALETKLLADEIVEDAAAVVTASDEPDTFDARLKALDPALVDEMVVDLAEQLDKRAAFEREVSPDNENIHKTLKKTRAAFTANKDTARVLLLCNVASDFLNRSISDGSRYNVYAFGKIHDLVKALTEGGITNAINNAVIRSLFSFRAAGVPFTGEIAKAAASDKIRIDIDLRKHLTSHTVAKSTASTQASSTMQALETLGLVQRSGTRRASVYTLIDSPALEKVAAKMGIAA